QRIAVMRGPDRRQGIVWFSPGATQRHCRPRRPPRRVRDTGVWNDDDYRASAAFRFGPVLICVAYSVRPVNDSPPMRLPSTVGISFQMM
ncbi:MAG: hypothetical protein JWR79_1079, partial [Tardiphaga sp.]|nr:hypothetical protein [Tardiphaga sp.]